MKPIRIKLNALVKEIQEYLVLVQSGQLGETTMDDLEICGALHGVLETITDVLADDNINVS